MWPNGKVYEHIIFENYCESAFHGSVFVLHCNLYFCPGNLDITISAGGSLQQIHVSYTETAVSVCR